MSARPQNIIWTASPHTIAKIDILEAYLTAYFLILGKSRATESFLYIDGFAGPNQYNNFEYGSPTAALNAARIARENLGVNWSAKEILFAFIESDNARYQMLNDSLPSGEYPFSIRTYNSKFADTLSEIMTTYPRYFTSSQPLFAFLDPFGAKGVPFSKVAELLKSRTSEVLINLDADGIARINKAGKNANSQAILTEAFGDNSWQEAFSKDISFHEKCREILKHYKQRLRTLPNVNYLFQMEMQKTTGNVDYYLLFASQHPLGLIKMKEAMKKLTKNGSYIFCDGHKNQLALFRDDNPEIYSQYLHKAFEGRTVKYDSKSDEITTYALNETPMLNAKSMLYDLEDKGMISVECQTGRHKGTFNDKVKAVTFHRRG